MANVVFPSTTRRPSIGNVTSSRRTSFQDEANNPSKSRIGFPSIGKPSVLTRRGSRTSFTADGTIITQTKRGSKFSSLLNSQETEKKRGWKQVQQNKSKFKDDALFKFRAVARLIVAFNRLIKSHSLRYSDKDEIAPYINGLRFYDFESIGQDVELLFDPRKFKANKQLRISDEAKRILCKPIEERTEAELHTAHVALRNIQSISEYPVRMQRKIIEVGQYEKYEAKRIIVRQGHRASSFYFILSGSVVVMLMEGGTKYARPVAQLNKGQAFGELAIINRTTRQSTVIAKETLEMLSISIEDFHRIFMAGGVKNINDPDHNEFIRSLDFLQGWPIEILMNDPKKCIFHYFKRGDILLKDSNFASWIYLVKSGSINVLKKLRRVEPYDGKKGHKKLKTEKEKQNERELLLKQRKFVLPDLHVPLREPTEVQDEKCDHLHEANFVTCTNTKQSYLIPGVHYNTRNNCGSPHSNHHKSRKAYMTERTDSFQEHSESDETSTRNSDRSADGSGNTRRHDVTVRFTTPRKYHDEENEKAATKETLKGKVKKKTVKKTEDSIEEEVPGFKQQVRTIVDDFDSSFKMKDLSDLTEADRDPQFVHVQTITKGQVFGLREAILGKQVSLCLVSNGAECILIDKNYYLDHAPEFLLRKMRQQCCPFPNDEELQDSLQNTVDWAAYKEVTLRKTMFQIKAKAW